MGWGWREEVYGEALAVELHCAAWISLEVWFHLFHVLWRRRERVDSSADRNLSQPGPLGLLAAPRCGGIARGALFTLALLSCYCSVQRINLLSLIREMDAKKIAKQDDERTAAPGAA